MLIANAVLDDVAAIERKSRVAAPGTIAVVQRPPPFVVRITVPRCPLAQATLGDTTLNPRSSASVPLDRATHCAHAGCADRSSVNK